MKLYDLARFAEDTEVQILSMNGQPLLNASVKRGSRLDVALFGGAKPYICSVVAPSRANEEFKILTSEDRLWGSLRKVPSGGFDIVHKSRTILAVDCEGLANSNLSVINGAKECVALARINVEEFPTGEYFEIRALPNTDVVLIVTVIMAIMVFAHPD